MKKLIVLLPVMLILLTGCGAKEGTIKCTLSSKDAVNGYSLESEYNINYKGDYVEKVDTVEKVTSESEEILDTFKTTLNDTYSKMNDTYGGYDYNVTKDGDTVTSKVTIDYSKMDIEQFVKDQPSLKSYVDDNKLKVDGIKDLYKTMGATCE